MLLTFFNRRTHGFKTDEIWDRRISARNAPKLAKPETKLQKRTISLQPEPSIIKTIDGIITEFEALNKQV